MKKNTYLFISECDSDTLASISHDFFILKLHDQFHHLCDIGGCLGIAADAQLQAEKWGEAANHQLEVERDLVLVLGGFPSLQFISSVHEEGLKKLHQLYVCGDGCIIIIHKCWL